jgi:hypothetical protein
VKVTASGGVQDGIIGAGVLVAGSVLADAMGWVGLAADEMPTT